MKTLTPEEILASELSCEIEDIGMAIFHNVQGYVLLKAIKVYHAQFQSQPSISAEEFLKEKALQHIRAEFRDEILSDLEDGIEEQDIELSFTLDTLSELLTEFASRQGKVVEVSRVEFFKDDGGKCPSCKAPDLFVDDNFCPKCGGRIVWK